MHILFTDSPIQQVVPGNVPHSTYSTTNKPEKTTIIMELTYKHYYEQTQNSKSAKP